MNNLLPNGSLEPPQNQPEHNSKPSALKLADINWGGVAILAFFLLICVVAWIIIRDLSVVGGGIGSKVMDWFSGASINPGNKRGFTNFLCLVLVAGFIYLVLQVLKKNK